MHVFGTADCVGKFNSTNPGNLGMGPFPSENIVKFTTTMGKNCAREHYKEGAQMIGKILDGLKREVSSVQQAEPKATPISMIMHSPGGGTGGGTGTLLMQRLREQYPDFPVVSVAIMPSGRFGPIPDWIVQNQMLSLRVIQDLNIPMLAFYNSLVFDALNSLPSLVKPNVGDINNYIARTLVGLFGPAVLGQISALRVVEAMRHFRLIRQVC